MNTMTFRRFASCGLHAALVLLVLDVAQRAHADSVYQCRDPKGHIAYQDRACSSAEQETRIEIAAAPKAEPAPDYAIAPRTRTSQSGGSRTASPRGRGNETLSYECRAGNGEIFYKHGGCPRSIKDDSAGNRVRGSRGRGNKRSANASVAVSAVPLPRAEVCRRLAAAGSIGRAGHEHDDHVSTYERNAGHDPCRRS